MSNRNWRILGYWAAIINLIIAIFAMIMPEKIFLTWYIHMGASLLAIVSVLNLEK